MKKQRHSRRSRRGTSLRRLSLICVGLLAALAGSTSAAQAAQPVLTVSSAHHPTVLSPGGTAGFALQVRNVGDASTTAPVTVTDTLPVGVTPLFAFGGGWSCSVAGQAVTCTSSEQMVGGSYFPQIAVSTTVTPSEGVLVNQPSVSGGGAAAATAEPDSARVGTDPISFGVTPGSFDAMAADSAGNWMTQAGGHPYMATTRFRLNTTQHVGGQGASFAAGQLRAAGTMRDVVAELPAGFVGNPRSAFRCTMYQLDTAECPLASQVGIVMLNTVIFGNVPAKQGEYPVFNMAPGPNEPALFAFKYANNNIVLRPVVGSRADDYRIGVEVRNIPQSIPLGGQELTLWGVPADPRHDVQRAYECERSGVSCKNLTGSGTGPNPGTPQKAGIPMKPFLTNPTACDQVSVTTVKTDSWMNPGAYVGPYSSVAPPATGCDKLHFNPTAEFVPGTAEADSPGGLSVNIHLPQNENPGSVATPSLKKAVVTLPVGMSVNPSSAGGLGGCTPGQIGIEDNSAPSCPESSAIGTVSIKTPLLEDPIPGQVYLASQKDNPFGSLLALYIVARGPGFVIKLPGKVEADPQSGQLKATFDDNPQLPFEDLSVQFKSGPRAPLITPSRCGTYTTEAALTPWAAADAPPVISRSSFQITSGPNGSPCPTNDLKPKLNAGTANPTGGASSSFNLQLSRDDATQQFQSLDVSLPEGLTAKLAGVPYCPEAALASYPSPAVAGTGAAELANPKCPAASQVGTATVGAGAGSNPFYVKTGKVYLAGPYKGQPLSLAILTPAVAGPFDLGTVLVRSAIHVDPTTAKISVASDPIPTILEGIPLDIRDVRVAVDRAEFMRNPTSCDPMAIDATVRGAQGATAQVSNRFQVGSCERLALTPKLALRLFGPTKRGQNPRLRAVLTQPEGQANIARVSVALPHSEFLDQSHIKTICTRVQYAARACPPGSVYGYAKAYSPLLEKPLQGPVYLRSSSNPLPDLVASLDGQVHIDLAGRIDSVRGGIRNTFEAVPDAPVSKFVLTMQGGKKSLLVNSRDLCKSVNRATVQIDGQNGRTADARPLLRNGCGKKGRK